MKHPELVAIKITPHFHETTPGLALIHEEEGFKIYKEANPGTNKDTSRMLKAGASKVYFAKVTDGFLHEAFNEIMKGIPASAPVICESPALRYFVSPGLFIIMSSKAINKQKDINELLQLPHVAYKIEELEGMQVIPLGFINGKWINEG